MEPIQRRPPSNPKRHWLLALLALALLAGALLWRGSMRPAAPVPPKREDRSRVLMDTAIENLESVTIYPSRADSYTLDIRAGKFFLPQQPAFQFDPGLEERMVQSLLYIEALDAVDVKMEAVAPHLADYGLADGSFAMRVRYQDGRFLGLRIGARVPGDLPQDYLLVDGSPELLTIAVDIRNTFDRRLSQLHNVARINFTPDLLERLDFEGETQLTLQRVAPTHWEIRRPYAAPVGAVAITRLLKSVGSLRLASYVERATPDALDRYGLAEPHARVRFSLDPSVITATDAQGQLMASQPIDQQTIQLDLGDRIEGLGFYCLYDGIIYQASDLSMGFLYDPLPRDYLGAYPIDLPLSILDSVSWQANGLEETYAIELTESVLPNNELEQDELGNVLHVFLISRQGKEIDPTAFARVYGQLMQLRSAGDMADSEAPIGEALLTLRLKHRQGERVVSFHALDALHCAVSINGRHHYYVERLQLNHALDAISGLRP